MPESWPAASSCISTPATARRLAAGWYDLNDPDQIAEATQYAHEEWGVPVGFVALTGFEGEGVVLYALKTGEVYDVELHRVNELVDGSMAPIAKTFEGYLLWCMRQQARR